MARKPNHAYEKRQRELAKQTRRAEKLARKQAAREEKESGPQGLPNTAGPQPTNAKPTKP